MSEDGIILGFFAAFFGVILLFLLVGVILYVLQAIGLFKIAKREGKGDIAWLAWIPVANFFVVPLLVENDVHEEIRGKFTLIAGIAFIASVILGSFTGVFSFLFLVVYMYGFYFIANRYSKSGMVHLVIAVITLGASAAISLFMFRNRSIVQ